MHFLQVFTESLFHERKLMILCLTEELHISYKEKPLRLEKRRGCMF